MHTVGVDAWNLPGDRRGVGRYVREVLRVWVRSALVEPVLIVPEWHTWTVARRYLTEVENVPLRVVSRALHRRAGVDVVWFPFNGCSWTTFDGPAVATLHDATPFVFEDKHGVAPIMRTAAQRCKLLLTDSEFSKQELIRELSVAPERLRVVHLGARACEQPPARSGEAPFVLFVGTTDTRKGIDVLVSAMRRVQEYRPDVSLVLAGARSDDLPATDGLRVEALGFVDDAQLEQLYRTASVFAFPSRYEGFGLPPLEAMRFDTPVVATAASSIPEVVGDAAVCVPVDDAGALATGLLAVLNSPQLQAELAARGRERVAHLSWERCARETLRVLQEAVG